jgi:hypothetical protein
VTSVLSIATPIFVAQVADRRLSFVDGVGNVSLADDNSNKLTLFCSRMAFGYTGLASIGGQKTDVWLAHLLGKFSGASLKEAIVELKQQATAVFANLPYSPRVKRHAFVGVGWACTDAEQLQFKPMLCRISNFYDKDERPLDSAQSEFSLAYRIYDPPNWGWIEVGAHMYPREIGILTRLLSRAARRGASYTSAVRLMVSAIRHISARDQTVGRNLLGIVMPSTVAAASSVQVLMGGGAGMFIGEGDPDFRAPTIESFFVPDGQSNGVIYAPNVACKGSALTNVSSGPL